MYWLLIGFVVGMFSHSLIIMTLGYWRTMKPNKRKAIMNLIIEADFDES